jgi:hypothetical protein
MKYDSKCQTCGTVHEYVRNIADRNDTPICCGEPTQREITLSMLASSTAAEWQAYKCPHSGEVIKSAKDRKEVMAKHSLVDAEPL